MARLCIALPGCFVLFVGCVASSTELGKARPVTKVINLMKDMLTELEHESKEDEEVYEAMGCWCETNDKEKTKAISDAEARVQALTASIQELTAVSSRLNSEIASLESEVTKNQEALEGATALRRKQLVEFNADEKDLLASIGSMKGAVSALSKHNAAAASFLQLSSSERMTSTMAAAATAKQLLRKHTELLYRVASPRQRDVLTSFLQTSSAPASGEIFGVLTGMQEAFEGNLEQSQKEETDNNNAYENLKAAKTSEIAAGKDLLETKVQELAAADEKNALSKQDLEDTQDTLQSDMTFLDKVKERCGGMDAQFEERTKTRQLEVEAVNKALSFLTSDDAHDLFSRTFNMAFLQSQSASQQRQQLMSRLLMAAAAKSGRPRLSMLALRIRGMRMERVTMALENMVKPLEEEQQAEVDTRNFCIDELHTNEADSAAKVREHADVTAKVDDAKMTIEELTKAIDELTTDIDSARVEVKRAGDNRAKANKDFQITVADQRATQKLLNGALMALKKVYAASLVQTEAETSSGQPAFKPYKKNKGGILGVIQGVIDDAKKLEAEAIRGEEDSQKAYEGFVKDTNDALVVMTKDLVNKKEDKAKSDTQKVQKEIELENVEDEQKHLEKAAIDLHAECDYILKNFDTRQAARHAEITAMKESIAITGGAPVAQLLQYIH